MIKSLKSYRSLIMFMAIPFSVMLSMFALRFLQKNGTKSTSYFGSTGVAIPANAIEFKPGSSNIDDAEADIEKSRHVNKLPDPKLVHLSFPETSSKSISQTMDPKGDSEAGVNDNQKRYRLPGLLKNASDKFLNLSKEPKANKLRNENMSSNISLQPRKTNLKNGSSPVTNQSTYFNGFSEGKEDISSNKGYDVSNRKNQGIENATNDENQILQAVVLGDQSVHGGSGVRFRTAQVIKIRNHIFQRNTLFIGYAVFKNDQVFFSSHKLGEGSNAIRVNMHCRTENDSGLPIHEKGTAVKNGINEVKDAAVDEVASNVPIASGVISRAGRSLFHQDKQKAALLNDGQEIEFVIESE